MSRRTTVRLSIDQLELTAEGTLPRRRRRMVSDTSSEAAARAATRTEALRALIMDVLRRHAPLADWRGMTSDEIHYHTATTEHEANDVRRLMTIRRRVSDLHTKFRLIEDTGLRRARLGGTPLIVWAPAAGASSAEVSDGK